MARKSVVRAAAISGAMFVTLASGAGVAVAAPYGGISASGVVTSGGGTATFTGSGFGPGSQVLLTVSSCGTSQDYNATASSAGTISVPTTGAGQTGFSATGTDGDGLPLTLSSTAMMSDACTVAAVVGNADPAAGGTGTGGLPFTGFEVGSVSAIGFVAIGGGVLVIAASRRRRRSEATG
jgi:hypothetical protein